HTLIHNRSFFRPVSTPAQSSIGAVAQNSFGADRQLLNLLSYLHQNPRDYERLPETLAGLHFVVFAMLMLVHAAPVLQSA
ncbi:hypothetical protein ADM96_38525, partial [Burkholderia sp. ST111]